MTADRLMIGEFIETAARRLITVVCWQSLALLLKAFKDFGTCSARNLSRWPDAHALAHAPVAS